MIIYDPCERLNTIYNQLVPSILNSAKNDTADNIRKAIEVFLPKLELKSYSLAGKCNTCIDCSKCDLCNKDNIQELFYDTQFKLDEIWAQKERFSDHSEKSCIPQYNSIDMVSPGFPGIPTPL